MKICISCKNNLDDNNFYKGRNQCKKCQINWIRRIQGNMFKSKNSERKYSEDKITSKFLRGLYEKQNGLCYWLKIPLDIENNDELTAPSLDRLDNDKGYSFDNIVLSSRFANLGRNTSTKEEFEEFLKTYILK